MTRNFAHYNYQKSKTSQYSYSYNLYIQPAFCGQVLGDHSFGLSDPDCIKNSDKITVYYQMGNSFTFIIPASFVVNSIIFDALDSSLLPTEKWLNENSQWWIINSDKTLNINTLNPSPPASWYIATIQTEEWKSTFGTSFFMFGYSDTLSNIDGVGTLTIINWEFQNFFYDFNSLIKLNNGHGKITIISSTFDKFSNCGSIIRDTIEYPKNINYIYAGSQSSKSITYRDSIFTSNLFQNKYNVNPSNPWLSNSWAMISISSSTFQNFNYMKTGGQTYHKVDINSKMKYQGLIINLNDFFGPVAFYSNHIINMRFSYTNWEEVYNNASQIDPANIWGNPSILQAKSLIYINVKLSDIEIYSNIFSNCNSLLGLVYLQRSSESISSILLHNNSFIQNSAIIGANAIKIDLFTNISYTSEFNSNFMMCAGVRISENYFNRNIGWFNTIGVIQAIWYTDGVDQDPSSQNHYRI